MPRDLIPPLTADHLTLGFDDIVIQRDLCFTVAKGAIFAIMGGSGCGKSTLLRAMIGLLRPLAGRVLIGDEDYGAASAERRAAIGRRFGVLFQNGALWTSMTVADNVALPLRLLTALDARSIDALVALKLALVGMDGSGAAMPETLSGGMRKRVGLARALSLDPDIVFFDEPSAGLDPITARRMDDLILEIRDGFGTTIVMVSHELPSLLTICDSGVFLDSGSKSAIAHGSPRHLRDSCANPIVQAFMNRQIPPPAVPHEN